MRRSWVLGVVSLPFGLLYCFLVCFFADAIEAYGAMEQYTFTGWGGPEVLFSLNSGALGWVSIVVLEYRLRTAGTVVLLIALPWCLLAIATGIGAGVVCLERVPGYIEEMVAFSVLWTVAASGVRTYFYNLP